MVIHEGGEHAPLAAAGLPCATRSDTEVLLNAYRAWGEACVERFRGMWAFCLADPARGVALLSRDRFGIKPLYLYRAPEGGLAFASELRALLALGPDLVPPDLDPLAVERTLEVLTSFADTGAPVLFSSHQLDLVERLVDDLVIINDGRLVAAGTTTELRRQRSLPEWTLQTDADLGWVRGLPDISVVELDGNWARFTAPNADAAEAVLRHALTVTSVSSFAPHEVALNRLFQEVTQS